MKKLGSRFGVAFILILVASMGVARISRSEYLSVETDLRRSFWDDLQVTLFSFSYGPGLGFENSYQPDGNGARLGPLALVNQLTVAAPAFGSMLVEVTGTFALQPWEQSAMIVKDPSVGIQGDIVNTPGFTLWGRYEAIAGVSDASRASGIVVTPQLLNVFGFPVAKTPFLIQAVVAPQVAIYNDGRARPGLYLSPRVFYQIGDNWRVLAIGEVNYLRSMNRAVFTVIEDYPPTLGLGVRYTWNSGRYWVQPFLNFFPFGHTGFDTVHPAVVMNFQLK